MDTESIYTPKYVYVQLQQVVDIIHKVQNVLGASFGSDRTKKCAGCGVFKDLFHK